MAKKVLLGKGKLNWYGGERRSDRYGTIQLSPKVNPQYGVAFDHTELAGTIGKLVVKVIETRKSGHLGDFFRGVAPKPIKVGAIRTLGEGKLFFSKNVYDPNVPTVGVEPLDGREHDWMNPRKLYDVHEQDVELYFEAS